MVNTVEATHVHPMTWTIFLVFYTRLQFPIDVVHQIYYAFLDAEYKDWRYYNQFRPFVDSLNLLSPHPLWDDLSWALVDAKRSLIERLEMYGNLLFEREFNDLWVFLHDTVFVGNRWIETEPMFGLRRYEARIANTRAARSGTKLAKHLSYLACFAFTQLPMSEMYMLAFGFQKFVPRILSGPTWFTSDYFQLGIVTGVLPGH